MGRFIGNVAPIEQDMAGIRNMNAGKEVKQGCLSGTVGSENTKDFSSPDLHGYQSNGLDASECFGKVFSLQDCFHRFGPLPNTNFNKGDFSKNRST